MLSSRRFLGLGLVAASALLLGIALSLPTVRFQRVGAPEEVYSIYGGVESLWRDGNRLSSAIVFAFSIAAPVLKLAFLGYTAWSGRVGERGSRWLRWLIAYGKWSMIDVFVIALFVGAIVPGFLANAAARPGIHVFAAAILISMAATHAVARSVLEPTALARPPRPRRRGAALPLAALTTAAWAFPTAFYFIRETLLSQNAISLPRLLRDLGASGERGLQVLLGLFLIAAPLAYGSLSLAWRWGGRPRARRVALALEEWAMLDVFALSLWMVYDKLTELVPTDVRWGFWAWIGAALAMAVDAHILRRPTVSSAHANPEAAAPI